MNTTARTSIIAIVALAIGGLGGYAYNASLPVSVTSTDVALSTPSGDAALAHTREGIAYLDKAGSATGKGNLDKAIEELTKAKGSFADVAKVDTDDDQPIAVAQEAIMVHQFSPSPDLIALGSVETDSADVGGMSLTKGRNTQPLALSDYSISFGDLSVDSDLVTSQIDLAIKSAKDGKQEQTADAIKKARGAVTFTISGDDVEE